MISETELRPTSSTPAKTYRVLHVLDHSFPVLSGYSVRSRSLIHGQHQIGFSPQAVTGPLHQLDDKAGTDTVVDDVLYTRTPIVGALARRSLQGRWPLLREASVVRLLRRRIIELVERGQFDVIHAHSPALCGLAALQAARATNLPAVYEIRAFWEDAAVDQKRTHTQALRYRATRALEDHVISGVDAVVGIATHILEDLHARGVPPEKLFHVSNGVDADRFSPQPRNARLAAELGLDGSIVFGFAGSLYHYEGISWLVRAVAELRRRGVTVKLLVLGEGEDLPAIRSAIRDTSSEQFVLAPGRVPHDQMQRYYSIIDVLVYPRRSNRLTELVTPLKPLEAMAQSKAVLASGVGGIRELVEHEKTGLLFKPEDIDDFCGQATRLVQQSDLRRRLGEQGRETILRARDWKVLARRYQDVYDYALAAHKRR